MYLPLHIPEFNIYDICYSIDRYVVVRPYGKCCPTHPFQINLIVELNNEKFKMVRDDRTEIYTCIQPFTDIINLKINGKDYDNLQVSKYPNLLGEVIMTTMAKKEDSYMVQWIRYNLKIGFTKLVIYDNKESKKTRYQSKEKKSNLQQLLKNFIENGTVILINWKYPKNNCINGQTTQQNHALYNFKNAKYIAFFDIDEYINVTNFNDNIVNIMNKILANYSACKICCKFFQNPNNFSEANYNFLKIDTYIVGGTPGFKLGKRGEIEYGAKIIVNPADVKLMRVHALSLHNKKKMITIKSKEFDSLYFNHYHFLNKLGRGKHKTTLTDDSLSKYYHYLGGDSTDTSN